MLLRTLNEVSAWAETVNWKKVCFDTETDSLKWFTLSVEGCSFCDGSTAAYVSFVRNPEAKTIQDLLWEKFQSTELIIGHNLVFDVKVLVKLFGKAAVDQWLLKVRLIDTYIASYLDDEQALSHKLKGPGGCCERYLNRGATTYKTAEKAGRNTQQFAEYAMADAINTWDLWHALRPKLVEQHLEKVFNLECAFIPVLVEMETAGVLIDQARLSQFETALDLHKVALLDEIEKVTGPALVPQRVLFGNQELEKKLNSPAAVFDYVTHTLGLHVENVDAEALEPHAGKYEFIRLLLEYRKVSKLLSTYLSPYWGHIDTDGRVRSSFKIISSGRLSSSRPNLTNIPQKAESIDGIDIRELFRPASGKKYLREDFSQQELRIAASNAGDVAMLKAFGDGIDVHMLVANEGKKLGIPLEHLRESSPEFKAIKKKYESVRTKFKAANFGMLYGRGAANLAKDWACSTQEAQAVVDDVFRMFPQIKKHIDGWHNFITRNGYAYTFLGRRKRYRAPISNGELRSGFNMTVQGGAADMAKLAAAAVWRFLRSGGYASQIVLWIHDEIILEGPEDELATIKPQVEKLMCEALPLRCPVKVDGAIVSNYGDKG